MIEPFDDDNKDLYGIAKRATKYAVPAETKYSLGRTAKEGSRSEDNKN